LELSILQLIINEYNIISCSQAVLTVTSCSYGKAESSTPTESKPLTRLVWNLAELIDYVRDTTPCAKFYANLPMGGGLLGKLLKYMQFFYLYAFFQKLTYRSDPFWGLKNSKLIFDPWKIPQSRKLGPKLDFENFQQKRHCIKLDRI